MRTAQTLDADERHEVHNARVLEVIAGEISGKEFVASLVSQVGFDPQDAINQWNAVQEHHIPAVYKLQMGEHCLVPVADGDGGFRLGRVTSFYGSNGGVVVELGSGLRLPFSLFEVRAAK